MENPPHPGGGDLFYKASCHASGQLSTLDFFFFFPCDKCFSCSRKEMCHLWFGLKTGKLAVHILFNCRFTLRFIFSKSLLL